MRRIFAEADAGRTAGDIARGLNRDGIPPLRARQWGKQTIAQMLRLTVYMGVTYYNRRELIEPTRRRTAPKEGQSKKTAQRFRPQAEWIEVRVTAIVDPAQFERVREQMGRTRALRVGRPSRAHLLRGLVKCAKCGRSLNATPNHGRPRYRCSNYNRLVTSERYCELTRTSVSVRALEDGVWSRIEQLYADPETMAREIRESLERQNGGKKDSERERASLRKTIDRLKGREAGTVQKLLDAKMADYAAQIKADLQRTRQQRREAEDRLKSLAVQPVPEIPDLDRLAATNGNASPRPGRSMRSGRF